jgi:L-lactate dehydrogenase complex protein LldE
MKIQLFITCLNDALFPRTGIATTEILERLGHTVEFDPRQTCCGQMHLNSGYTDEAVKLAERWLDIYESAECIVSPSGSCVANVREMFAHAGRWTHNSSLVDRAAKMEGKLFELSEFLLEFGGMETLAPYFPHKVTYHPTCHGARALGLMDSPEKLLRQVRGLELVELSEKWQCCGFGGTFSVKNPETSSAMLNDKCAAICALEVEYCVAIDNSCLMHIGGGLRKDGRTPKVIHLAEVLASRGQA